MGCFLNNIFARILGVFISLLAPFAFAENFGDPQVLHLVSTLPTSLQNPVDVRFALEKDTLIAEFEVRTPEIYARETLGKGEYPYQRDVVELFIAVRGNSTNLPYYEFELSPNDQSFQVLIKDPKKLFVEGIDLGLKHSVTKTETGWIGELRIPLKPLGWKGDPKKITGNAYAILGKPPRSFWSLYLPKQMKPQFHSPQYFQPLFK